MDQLKKIIVDNLYKSNFYEVLINIKKLEDEAGQTEEVFTFYYFLYDLMQWISKHKQDKNIKQNIDKKEIYFNKINEQNSLDKSSTYVKLYTFLEENFRTFDRFTWFRKKEKSINLLNQAIEENSNNLEAQFYILFCKKKFKECFEFLNANTIDIIIVQKLIGKVWFQDDFLDDVQQIRIKYELDNIQNDFRYYAQKKDYKWLYKYFNDNKSEIFKDKDISFGKVCFKFKKYDKAIKFYNDKNNKDNTDYLILGECYEKQNEKYKAIECYKDYYTYFTSGNWKDGLEKLFKLKAYDEIKYIFENVKSDFHNKEYKIFYEAKLFNIEKQYDDSINKLNGIFDLLHNYHTDLKKDIYLLYISNYYKKTIYMMNTSYDRTIKSKDFELNYFGLNYNNLHIYIELEKYIKKLNIEYDNKYIKKTEYYKNLIHNKYLNLHQNIYYKIKKIDFKLTEDEELYYLSAFDDNDSFNKRIKIYKKRVEEQPENSQYYLQLGRLYYNKAKLTNKNFKQAVENLKKSIKLAQKYFINLNGEPELMLVEINGGTKEENKQLFDNSMKNFIFHSSYQKDTQTTYLDQALYKYQNFSMNYLSSLANNYLYFASPNKLNDPFDVASESLEKQFDDLEINQSDFKTCSLSKNNDNKLMWSHYSKEHTGLCVGYKFLYLPSYVGKDEVKYKNTKLDEKDIFESILDYWIVKSEDWEYEQEVRLLHYGNKEKIQYTFDVNQALKDNIIALRIDSITLGLEFQEDEIIKQIIKEIENKQKLKIKTFKTRMIKQNLVVEKINL